QDLPLEGERAEHPIERADPIGDDDDALAVDGIIVADLALVFLSDPEVGGVEGDREALLERFGGHGHGGSPRLLGVADPSKPAAGGDAGPMLQHAMLELAIHGGHAGAGHAGAPRT